MEQELLKWDSPEYIKNPRTADWYWGVALLGGAIIFACVYFGNYMFGIVVLLSTILLIATATRPPHLHAVIFTSTGLKIDGKLVEYEHISAYWIASHHREGDRLLLRSDAVWMPVTVLPLAGAVTTQEVRSVLQGRVVESEITIPIIVQVFEELF